MIPLHPETVLRQLEQWKGKDVYIHLEVNPEAYIRNAKVELIEAHVKGDGPYRVFLELGQERGLIQINGITHMSVDENMVICTGYDDQNRLAQTLEVSIKPFSM
jgi:hypothetical protein